jgi:HEPN domain-containing protein
VEVHTVNRTEFQQLAEVRVKEAEALLAAGRWDGAYYLAGYAVECGLKACIAKLTKAEDFPDKKFAADCFTHDIEQLVRLAGLKPAIDAETKADPQLALNWGVVKDWSESRRYDRTPEPEARKLVEAITDPTHGVLPWLMKHW